MASLPPYRQDASVMTAADHVARVERLKEAFPSIRRSRHAVDDALNLTVRTAHVDTAVLARDEPGR